MDDYYEIKPLHIMLSKPGEYIKNCHDENKCILKVDVCLIKDDELLQKHKNIREQFSTVIEKNLIAKSAYNKIILKNKIKS